MDEEESKATSRELRKERKKRRKRDLTRSIKQGRKEDRGIGAKLMRGLQ